MKGNELFLNFGDAEPTNPKDEVSENKTAKKQTDKKLHNAKNPVVSNGPAQPAKKTSKIVKPASHAQ